MKATIFLPLAYSRRDEFRPMGIGIGVYTSTVAAIYGRP